MACGLILVVFIVQKGPNAMSVTYIWGPPSLKCVCDGGCAVLLQSDLSIQLKLPIGLLEVHTTMLVDPRQCPRICAIQHLLHDGASSEVMNHVQFRQVFTCTIEHHASKNRAPSGNGYGQFSRTVTVPSPYEFGVILRSEENTSQVSAIVILGIGRVEESKEHHAPDAHEADPVGSIHDNSSSGILATWAEVVHHILAPVIKRSIDRGRYASTIGHRPIPGTLVPWVKWDEVRVGHSPP